MRSRKIGRVQSTLALPSSGITIIKWCTSLQRFGHEQLQKIQNAPHPHVAPTYGAKVQYVEIEALSVPLDKDGQNFIQAVTGTLLYYS